MSRRRQQQARRREWQPMAPAVAVPWTETQRATALALCEQQGIDIAELDPANQEMWRNDRYVATVSRDPVGGYVDHISFRRDDRKPLHDWRDVQRIKTDIAGPDVEAVELYPAEARLVDTANQYHLWCWPPGLRLPIGFSAGMVMNDASPFPGSVQRPR